MNPKAATSSVERGLKQAQGSVNRLSDDGRELLFQRLNSLRDKLLDLSNRNRLLSFKHSERSRTHIRLIDELPDVLFAKLKGGQKLRFKALPEPESKPLDEETDDFLMALEAARASDETYHAALRELGAGDGRSEREAEVERSLRDRVRDSLGMSPWNDQTGLSKQDLARFEGLEPSYDVPMPRGNDPDEESRHLDNEVQTLLFPREMDRKLAGIRDQARTMHQEAGVNTLYLALGFLEWREAQQSEKKHFSPLLLLPASLEYRRGQPWGHYLLFSDQADVETNKTLEMRLERDFGFEMPHFEANDTPETFLQKVIEATDDQPNWSVRRFLTVGNFGFSKLTMFNDLAVENWPTERSLSSLPLVQKILLGVQEKDDGITYAPEYQIDSPEIEAKNITLVADADASQHSAVVDAIDGKNLVIKGPPGTGKSQTITNIIAAALDKEKSILFVSEKMAALEVVEARLRDAELTDFCLQVHSSKTSKLEVLESVRQRLELQEKIPEPRLIDTKLAELRSTRDDLNHYVSRINTTFGAMDLTVQQVLWGQQRARIEGGEACALVHGLDFKEADKVSLLARSQAHNAIEAAFKRVSDVAERYGSLHQHPWYWLRCETLDPFQIEGLNIAARQWHQALEQVSNQVDLFVQRHGPLRANSVRQLNETASEISQLPNLSNSFVGTLAFAISDLGLVDMAGELLSLISEPEGDSIETVSILPSGALPPISSNWLESADRVSASLLSVQRYSPKLASIADVREEISNLNQNADRLLQLATITRRMHSAANSHGTVTHQSVADTLTAFRLLSRISRDALLHRSQSLIEELVEVPLTRAVETSRELATARQNLEELAVLQPIPKLEEVAAHTSNLRASGALGVLGGALRKAKRFFRQLSKNPRQMSVSDMISLGTALTDYLHNRRQLEGDQLLKSACDKWFEGAETDFELLLEVSRWQRKVCQQLSDSEGAIALQSFLLNGSVDDLTALIADAEDITIEKAQRLVEELAEINCGIERFHDLMHDQIKALNDALDALSNQGFRTDAAFDLVAEFARLLAYLEPLRARLEGAPDVTSITVALLRESLNLIKVLSRAGISLDALSELASIESEVTIENLQSLAEELSVALDTEAEQRRDFQNAASIDLDCLTDGKDLVETPVPVLYDRLQRAISNPQTLVEHLDLQIALRSAREATPVNFVENLIPDPPNPVEARFGYDWLLYRALAKLAFEQDPALANFNGLDLQAARERFQGLDREILALQRKKICSKLCAQSIPRGNGVGRKSTYTDLALIRNELSKRKRHIPLRQLFLRAPKAIRKMKPCFMMSPLSVATYLKAGQFEFDLAVIDEASQMPLEDALGLIARAKQIIVVGDPMQLPPTSFFKRFDDVMDDEEDEEDEDLDVESVLDQAYNVFRPPRELRWHYRSRHQSLIAFSNRYFYDNGLTIFPSYIDKHEHYGVKLVQVDGCYTDRHNPTEAKQIAAWAQEFMKSRPGESLGLVAINQLQRDILVDEMNRIFQRDSQADAYRRKWDGTLYPFFVKNLENVQGDERDAIAISLVYGPNADGRLTNNFGPISKRNGERRLNVLLTRARNQLVIFSSMTADKIRISDNTLRGPRILRNYLDYALTGRLDSGIETNRLPDSDFEVFVANRLRSYGYEIVPQVGVAGFFIDLGVRYPEFPNIFLVGVECDGATYHSSKSARDRDRLREEVLKDLGWKLYRVWSTDWFRDPDKEVEKLCHFIELAAEERRELMRRPAPSIEEVLPIDEAEGMADLDDVSDEKGALRVRETEVVEDSSELRPTDDEDVTQFHEDMKEAVETAVVIRAPSITVEVGDTVSFHFDDEPDESHRVTIVAGISDPEQDYISRDSPIGHALLDTTVGDEAEIEAPGGVRVAIVEFIEKPPLSEEQRPEQKRLDGAEDKKLTREKGAPDHTADTVDHHPIASRTASDGQMYQPWNIRALPDPRDTPQAEVARHMREIVAAEGPVRVNRVYQIYARACGINRVGRMVRSKLNSALYSLVRQKEVLSEKEGPDDSQINAIARLIGAPRVIVRSAGPRTFWDIPPSELATVMLEERNASPGSDDEEIYRRVLSRYEVGRLTSNIRSELVRINRVPAERLFGAS